MWNSHTSHSSTAQIYHGHSHIHAAQKVICSDNKNDAFALIKYVFCFSFVNINYWIKKHKHNHPEINGLSSFTVSTDIKAALYVYH